MRTCLLVSGDFTPWGGMDRPNYELARHLAERGGVAVHLAAHSVAEPLLGQPRVTWHRVPRPLGRHALGAPLLSWTGRRLARALSAEDPGTVVIVNGGNCPWPGVNWVHALHAVWEDDASRAPLAYRLRAACLGASARRAEARALAAASLVLANSEMTRRQIVGSLGVPEERVRAVYYGVDAEVFRPASPEERAAARRRLGWSAERPAVVFIGALGYDRRKGFDVLFSAWEELCKDPSWDADLVAAGAGAEAAFWSRRAAAAGLSARVRLMGFTKEIPALLAAADALASPTRYEAYGQGVHEALCCGLPAFVTRTAGIAERYPEDLADLLLDAPPDAADLARRLKRWRADMPGAAARAARFGAQLRRRSWSDMSREIAGLLEAG